MTALQLKPKQSRKNVTLIPKLMKMNQDERNDTVTGTTAEKLNLKLIPKIKS